MSSSKTNMARKMAENARKVSAFSKDIEFKEIKQIPTTDDFVARFSENTGARKDFSNEYIVNVLPNFVPILCYILYYVNNLTKLIEIAKHAKISAGSFTAYCLAIVYGYILCCDCYVRPVPSQHAYEWLNDAKKVDFLEFLMSLPVPTFLVPILTKLTPTTSERRGNISFVPSAAGFFYTMHFGRFFPLNMFTNIHDATAENASNMAPPAIMFDYFSRSLYTITRHRDGAAAFNASPAHFLGTWFLSGGTAAADQSTYGSRLEQLFQSVFNPVLFRDAQRRQTLASISIMPPTFATRFMNFYDLVFSCSARSTTSNLSEYRIVFQSISAALNGTIPCSGDLASQFKSFSGNAILDHGYSAFRLPTFHHSTTAPQNMNTRPKRVSPADFASAIRFLQEVTEATMPTRADYTQPAAVCTTDRTHRTTVTYTSTWNRLMITNTAPFVPAFSDFITFSESQHLYPKVYVMKQDGSTVDAWMSTAFGFVIESNDIDGTVIPYPNTSLSLGIENTWFADSCIPIRYCYWQTMFDVQATTSRSHSLRREIAPRQSRFAAASLLVNRMTINLARLASRGATISGDASTVWPGLTNLDNVNWPQMIQNFLGFRTADPRSPLPADDAIPGMTRQLLVWSPYTYVGVEGENGYTPAFDQSRTYFLTNLRSLFGTDVPLIECNDALEAMPIF